jgi:hypothetical protein
MNKLTSISTRQLSWLVQCCLWLALWGLMTVIGHSILRPFLNRWFHDGTPVTWWSEAGHILSIMISVSIGGYLSKYVRPYLLAQKQIKLRGQK